MLRLPHTTMDFEFDEILSAEEKRQRARQAFLASTSGKFINKVSEKSSVSFKVSF